MVSFVIIEVDNGFTLVEILSGQSPEDVALSEGGVLVDDSPYESYEEANDALDQLESLEEEEGL